MNVGDWATKRALFPLTGDKTAFIYGDRTLTYREFNRRVNQEPRNSRSWFAG